MHALQQTVVLDAIVKASLILAATGLIAAVLRRASAAARHMIWTLGLMGALIVPALAMALPRWEVPLVRLSTETVDAALPAAIPAPAPPAIAHHRTPTTNDAAASTGSADPTKAARALPSWSTSLLLIWSIGALLIVGRMLVGLVAVQWMSRRTALVTDAPWLTQARELARDLGLSRVRFLRTGAASMPMAWGILRPSVLMPADADSWPDERLRIVLLHELAHVKRRDCLTHLFAQLACAAYWFNPLAWMAVGRLRAERERACDDLVLAAGTRGADYANQLLEIARVMNAGRFPAVLAGASLAMAHRSQLEGRLIAILDPTVPRRGLTRLRAGVAAGVFAVVLVPVASVQPWAEERAAVKTQDVVPVPASAQTPQPLPVPAPPAEPPAPAPVPAPQPMSAKVPASEWHTAGQEMPHAVADGMAHGIGQGVAQGVSQGIATGVGTGMATAVESVVGHVTEAAAAQGEEKERAHANDPRTVAALIEALKDSDKEVRETALSALTQMRDPRVYEPLTTALKDADANIRQQAAFGLGQLRDQRAIEPLTAALQDASADVREQAAFALGQIRAKSAVGALSAALKDSNADVREQAVFALGQIRDVSSVDALAGALHDPNDSVREQAAFALGQIRDRRAVDPLIAALKDAKPDVREQAAFALGQLRDSRAVEALVIAMKDPNVDVREQTAFALGQIRDARAIDALTAALKDASASVRQQAAFALGQIR
jgi:HEAT repeat protein/beta-lactamase regulating signal transducer with metallopeptidase domain